MSEMTVTDMGPFMKRHDRRSRRVFLAMTTVSLLVSAAAFTYGVLEHGSPAAIPARLWFPILVCPLPIIGLWMGSACMARKARTQPDGSLPMNPDDARDAARVANAGSVFVAGTSVVCIASQVGMLSAVNAIPSPDGPGLWIWRALIVATGALMVYFGNTWPRMPAPRAPEQKPATQRQFNRSYGWAVVIHGLLFVMAGLAFPDRMQFIVGAAVISLSMLVFVIAWAVLYRRAMRLPRPSGC